MKDLHAGLPIDVDFTLRWMDEPTELGAVRHPSSIFLRTWGRRSLGDVSSTTNSGQSGRKRSFSRWLNPAGRGRATQAASGERMAVFGSRNIALELNATSRP